MHGNEQHRGGSRRDEGGRGERELGFKKAMRGNRKNTEELGLSEEEEEERRKKTKMMMRVGKHACTGTK